MSENSDKTKQEVYEARVKLMLDKQLKDLKGLVANVESILDADMLDINSKAIKVLECMQSVNFNTYILRELEEARK